MSNAPTRRGWTGWLRGLGFQTTQAPVVAAGVQQTVQVGDESELTASIRGARSCFGGLIAPAVGEVLIHEIVAGPRGCRFFIDVQGAGGIGTEVIRFRTQSPRDPALALNLPLSGFNVCTNHNLGETAVQSIVRVGSVAPGAIPAVNNVGSYIITDIGPYGAFFHMPVTQPNEWSPGELDPGWRFQWWLESINTNEYLSGWLVEHASARG